MGRVREFRREDIPEVADVWVRVFRGRDLPAPPALRAYFEEVFFANPWVDETLPSLVYVEDGVGIVGFRGVLPRPMVFREQAIRAAVGTQVMVDRTRHHGTAAIELMRRFLAGPQDLSFTDGANDRASRLWTSVGAEVALAYSLCWMRVLRPAAYAAARLGVRRGLSGLTRAARPACALTDAAVTRLGLGPVQRPRSADVGRAATAASLLAAAASITGVAALRPVYERSSLEWLLTRAAEARHHGVLRAVTVHEPGGELLGWYVYHVQRGAVSQVLQIGATARTIGRVLDHLFTDAWRRGAVAVAGQVDPRFVQDLSDAHCLLSCPGRGVLIHSVHRDILDAIHRGEALLSRLDGEWWLRFAGEAWV